MCVDILKYLSGCKQLTSLDLSGQDLSNQGKLLTEIMKKFGSSSLLEHLYLEDCSIPEDRLHRNAEIPAFMQTSYSFESEWKQSRKGWTTHCKNH